MPFSSSRITACHDPERAKDACVLCQKPVCSACAVAVTDGSFLCAACAAPYAASSSSETEAEESPLSGSILRFNQAPAITLFCIVLVAAYFLPVLLNIREGFLISASLDVQAVVEKHQYWRLVTAHLAHANLSHLGLNVLSLLIFGHLVETRIKRPMLWGWILLSAIGCDIASVLFHVPRSVGASGIAYGLQTAFVVLTGKTLMVNNLQAPSRIWRSLAGYVLIILVINLTYTQQINIYGHLGGAIAGMLGAAVYPVSRPLLQKDRIILLLLIAAAIAALTLIIR